LFVQIWVFLLYCTCVGSVLMAWLVVSFRCTYHASRYTKNQIEGTLWWYCFILLSCSYSM